MSPIFRIASAAALWLAASASHAVPLTGGAWQSFDFYDDVENAAWVDGDLQPVTFEFTATQHVVLKVTDAGLAGDRFEVLINGLPAGFTSAPGSDTGDTSHDLDFDAAYADAQWSHGVFELGPGTYSVTGRAVAFAPGVLAGTGAVLLAPAVPEPETWALFGVGALLVAGALRRQARI